VREFSTVFTGICSWKDFKWEGKRKSKFEVSSVELELVMGGTRWRKKFEWKFVKFGRLLE
jgi:hypothetical protein